MRIVHFATDLDRASGGPSTSVPGLCRALGDLPDMEVHLVARRTDNPVLERGEGFVLRWIDGSASSVRRVLAKTFSASGGDETILQLNGLWDPMFHYAARFARRHGIPTVHSVRGMLEPWALRHKQWKKRLGWALYQGRDLRAAAALHATSEMETESIRRMGLGGKLCLLAPNGVAPPTEMEAILAETRRKPVLLFIGRIHPIKGLDLLLEGWAAAAPEGWTLRLAGPDEGGHRAVLEKKAERLQIAESVRFTGPIGGLEKWKALAEASVLVLPSHSENFGLVVAEALAAGTPAVASRGTPWSSLPREGAGWWVEPNAWAWSAFLRELATTPPERLEEMGRKGRELAARDYGWNGVAERFARHYRAIARESRRAGALGASFGCI